MNIIESLYLKAVASNVYNKSEVYLRLTSLIGAAPAVLDTVIELATALGNDSNYAATIQTQINNKADKINTY